MADSGADAFTLAAIFGWSGVRMALRYTHATDEAKRRAVENLVKTIGPSEESVTKENGSVADMVWPRHDTRAAAGAIRRTTLIEYFAEVSHSPRFVRG